MAIECIDAVVFSGDAHDVMNSGRNIYRGHDKRLR